MCEGQSLTVWKWCCSALSWVIMMGDVMVCLLMLLRLCCNSGIVCGHSVVSQKLLENGHTVLWVCLGPSLLFQSIEYIKCILPAHTPAADMIKWVNLDVVYEVICAPPPISLGSYLKDILSPKVNHSCIYYLKCTS